MSNASLTPDVAGDPPFQKREARASTAAANGSASSFSGIHRPSARLSSVRESGPHRESSGVPAEGPPEGEDEIEEGGGALLSAVRGSGFELNETNLFQSPPNATNQSLGVREYLDTEIVPALLPALSALCEERPPAPVEFLAHYLLEKNYTKTD